VRGAKLAYKTFGTLNASKDNVIVYPTWYSGQHYENERLIGEGMALDRSKYFIISPNMFGNGLSTSPSNAPPPYDRGRFPGVTLYDNVRQQHRLVTEKFGIDKVALVVGWSMGAQQTSTNGVRSIPTWSRALRRSAGRPGRRGTISYSSEA
jgi:homoserine O-acetyltransferase